MIDQTDIIGTLEIETSFTITDRGFVALGRFIDGRAKLGSTMQILINVSNITVKIIGIEWGNMDAEGTIKWGLFFRLADKTLKAYVETNRLEKQVTHIHAPQ